MLNHYELMGRMTNNFNRKSGIVTLNVLQREINDFIATGCEIHVAKEQEQALNRSTRSLYVP